MKVLFMAISFIVISIAVFTHIFLPTIVTNSRLVQASEFAKANHVKDGTTYMKTEDWWERPIIIRSGSIQGGYAYVYTAVSAVKDAKFGTEDDLQKTKIDINKSKILGHYVAKKFKEVLRGWKNGLKEKSKWSEN